MTTLFTASRKWSRSDHFFRLRIASHVLIGLPRSLVASLRIEIGRHRITDTTKHHQMRIRSTVSLHRRQPRQPQRSEYQHQSN
jgi:hypothetical protein